MLPLIKTSIPPREILIPRLEEVLYSGYVAQGKVVEEFERKFQFDYTKNEISIETMYPVMQCLIVKLVKAQFLIILMKTKKVHLLTIHRNTSEP